MRPERRTARARLGAAEADLRRNPGDEARSQVDTLRRDYRVLALEDHIREVVAAAPPLSEEQRQRLALLLRGTPSRRGSRTQ